MCARTDNRGTANDGRTGANAALQTIGAARAVGRGAQRGVRRSACAEINRRASARAVAGLSSGAAWRGCGAGPWWEAVAGGCGVRRSAGMRGACGRPRVRAVESAGADGRGRAARGRVWGARAMVRARRAFASRTGVAAGARTRAGTAMPTARASRGCGQVAVPRARRVPAPSAEVIASMAAVAARSPRRAPSRQRRATACPTVARPHWPPRVQHRRRYLVPDAPRSGVPRSHQSARGHAAVARAACKRVAHVSRGRAASRHPPPSADSTNVVRASRVAPAVACTPCRASHVAPRFERTANRLRPLLALRASLSPAHDRASSARDHRDSPDPSCLPRCIASSPSRDSHAHITPAHPRARDLTSIPVMAR